MNQQRYRLKTLEIDPLAGLVAGPGGRETLDPKVMAVFMLMAHQAGKVVLREELLARLWPNVIVTDDAVYRCICVLRRQLSQASGDPCYRELIETLPKRGYRLNADVETVLPGISTAAPQRAHHRAWALAAAFSTTLVLLVIVAARVG